jgi:hypothetical protein
MIATRSTTLQAKAAALFLLAAPLAHAEGASTCADEAERAQDLRRAGHLIAAREALIACGAASCPTVVRRDCLNWLADVDATLPTVIVRARDDRQEEVFGVRVLVDGEEVKARQEGLALAIDPGIHVFRVDATGFVGAEQRVLISEGEKNRFLDLVLERERSSAPIAAYATLGVGIVALSSFVVLEILAQREYDDLSNGCAPTHSCAASDVEDVRRKFALAGVSLGIGVVASGVGAAWILLARRAARIGPATVNVGIQGMGGRLRVEF